MSLPSRFKSVPLVQRRVENPRLFVHRKLSLNFHPLKYIEKLGRTTLDLSDNNNRWRSGCCLSRSDHTHGGGWPQVRLPVSASFPAPGMCLSLSCWVCWEKDCALCLEPPTRTRSSLWPSVLVPRNTGNVSNSLCCQTQPGNPLDG